MKHNTTGLDARSPPEPQIPDALASIAAKNTTAEPPLGSGFGSLIDREHTLRGTLAECDGRIEGNHAADVERILQHQVLQMDANIALLEQRYEGIANGIPVVASIADRLPPGSEPGSYGAGDILPDLRGQHASLMADIDVLLERSPDGQRGELILAEVKRNHEEMVWMLTALLSEDATAAPAEAKNARTAGTMSRAQENWDNEGGPTPPATSER